MSSAYVARSLEKRLLVQDILAPVATRFVLEGHALLSRMARWWDGGYR